MSASSGPGSVDKGKNQFYMAYSPEKGFQGHWDFYAEQLSLYVLAAGSPTHPIDVYDGFTRHKASYKNCEPFIHSWFGSLFTYQFSHAWVDFRGLVDRDGVDWFNNSVVASQASRQFAIDLSEKFKGVGKSRGALPHPIRPPAITDCSVRRLPAMTMRPIKRTAPFRRPGRWARLCLHRKNP